MIVFFPSRPNSSIRRKNIVGTLADRDLALGRIGLALLVESHHHDGGARQMLMDVNQSDGDGALMAQVAAQVQDLHRMKVLETLR